jgi:hypothetical protein
MFVTCMYIEVLRSCLGYFGKATVLMVDVLSTSETSVNFYQTKRRNIKDSHLILVVKGI